MESPMVGTFMVNLAKQTGVWVEINRRQETALLSMRGIDLEHNRCIIVLIILAVNNVVKYQKEPRPLKPAGSRVVSEYKIVMLIEQGTASIFNAMLRRIHQLPEQRTGTKRRRNAERFLTDKGQYIVRQKHRHTKKYFILRSRFRTRLP